MKQFIHKRLEVNLEIWSKMIHQIGHSYPTAADAISKRASAQTTYFPSILCLSSGNLRFISIISTSLLWPLPLICRLACLPAEKLHWLQQTVFQTAAAKWSCLSRVGCSHPPEGTRSKKSWNNILENKMFFQEPGCHRMQYWNTYPTLFTMQSLLILLGSNQCLHCEVQRPWFENQAVGSNLRGQKSQPSNCTYFTKHTSQHATETLKFLGKAAHLLCQLLSIWHVLEWKPKIGCVRLLLQQLGCHVTTLCQRGEWLFSLCCASPLFPFFLWLLVCRTWSIWGNNRHRSRWAWHIRCCWCSCWSTPFSWWCGRWSPAERKAQTLRVKKCTRFRS